MSDFGPPPRKTRKVSLANHATEARLAKKASNKAKTKKALQARHPNINNATAAARDKRQYNHDRELQIKQSRKSGRLRQNQMYKHDRQIHLQQQIDNLNNLQTLFAKINDKFNEYLLLDDIDVSLL